MWRVKSSLWLLQADGAQCREHLSRATHKASNKLTSVVENTKSYKLLCAWKSRRDWKRWLRPATLERLGISLNEISEMTQASDLVTAVSTNLCTSCYLCAWTVGGLVTNWCPPVLEWRGRGELPGILWTGWCLQQPHFHAVHRRRCCFFSSLPPFSFPFFPSLY